MIVEFGSGWAVEIDHGPDWLFARLLCPETGDASGVELAVQLWRLYEQEFAHRLVLEMEDVPLLRSELVGELVRLHRRITSKGGIMRLASLSDANYAVIESLRLTNQFPRYRDRHEAVLGYRPKQPR